MAISEDWLLCRITPDEVEGDLAEWGAPDLWLRPWRAMLDRLGPGDELWEYGATEYASAASEPADEIPGFARVVDGEIPRPIEDPGDRIAGFRAGFALVREGEIIDWIEAPPWIR